MRKANDNRGVPSPYKEPKEQLDPIVYQLRKRRYDMGMTADAVAELIGCTGKHLLNLERGMMLPNLRFLYAWAKTLEMRITIEREGN